MASHRRLSHEKKRLQLEETRRRMTLTGVARRNTVSAPRSGTQSGGATQRRPTNQNTERKQTWDSKKSGKDNLQQPLLEGLGTPGDSEL